MKEIHKSVLLQEAIDSLSLKEDDVAVDMTLGFAGHSSEILKRIKKGYLFAFDQDSEVFTYSRNRLNAIGNNFELIHANFSEAKEELLKRNITKVDAILYDLGVSSYRLDNKERGFSYNNDAVLDMRMNRDNPLTAKIVVNTYSEQELTRIFKLYGESKFARNIARNIVNKRKEKEINTTLELVSIIKEAVPIKERLKKHPAKQIFQAIRIEVNKELDVLVSSLNDSLDLLNVGGRLAVITFHSLEDKIVKDTFRKVSETDFLSKGLPNIPEDKLPDFKIITKKGIVPTDKEEEDNTPEVKVGDDNITVSSGGIEYASIKPSNGVFSCDAVLRIKHGKNKGKYKFVADDDDNLNFGKFKVKRPNGGDPRISVEGYNIKKLVGTDENGAIVEFIVKTNNGLMEVVIGKDANGKDKTVPLEKFLAMQKEEAEDNAE